MSLVTWKPLGEVKLFRKEMNHLLSDFFGEGTLVLSFGKEWTSSADISETSDEEKVVLKTRPKALTR